MALLSTLHHKETTDLASLSKFCIYAPWTCNEPKIKWSHVLGGHFYYFSWINEKFPRLLFLSRTFCLKNKRASSALGLSRDLVEIQYRDLACLPRWVSKPYFEHSSQITKETLHEIFSKIQFLENVFKYFEVKFPLYGFTVISARRIWQCYIISTKQVFLKSHFLQEN